MIRDHHPIPPKQKRTARLPQLSKSNRRLRAYYAELVRRQYAQMKGA